MTVCVMCVEACILHHEDPQILPYQRLFIHMETDTIASNVDTNKDGPWSVDRLSHTGWVSMYGMVHPHTRDQRINLYKE